MGGIGGPLWGVAVLGMLAVLIVVFVRQLRRSSDRSGPLVAIGVLGGLLVAGIALLLALRSG